MTAAILILMSAVVIYGIVWVLDQWKPLNRCYNLKPRGDRVKR